MSDPYEELAAPAQTPNTSRRRRNGEWEETYEAPEDPYSGASIPEGTPSAEVGRVLVMPEVTFEVGTDRRGRTQYGDVTEAEGPATVEVRRAPTTLRKTNASDEGMRQRRQAGRTLSEAAGAWARGTDPDAFDFGEESWQPDVLGMELADLGSVRRAAGVAGDEESDVSDVLSTLYPQAEGTDYSDATALGEGVSQGLTLGFADEIAGAVRPGMSYEEARDMARTEGERLREEHPGTVLAGEVAGGAAWAPLGEANTVRGLGTAGRAALQAEREAMSLGQRLAGGAGLAGLEGMVGGFGSAEGDVMEQGAQAGRAGLFGGALGAAGDLGGDAIGLAARGARGGSETARDLAARELLRARGVNPNLRTQTAQSAMRRHGGARGLAEAMDREGIGGRLPTPMSSRRDVERILAERGDEIGRLLDEVEGRGGTVSTRDIVDAVEEEARALEERHHGPAARAASRLRSDWADRLRTPLSGQGAPAIAPPPTPGSQVPVEVPPSATALQSPDMEAMLRDFARSRGFETPELMEMMQGMRRNAAELRDADRIARGGPLPYGGEVPRPSTMPTAAEPLGGRGTVPVGRRFGEAEIDRGRPIPEGRNRDSMPTQGGGNASVPTRPGEGEIDEAAIAEAMLAEETRRGGRGAREVIGRPGERSLPELGADPAVSANARMLDANPSGTVADDLDALLGDATVGRTRTESDLAMSGAESEYLPDFPLPRASRFRQDMDEAGGTFTRVYSDPSDPTYGAATQRSADRVRGLIGRSFEGVAPELVDPWRQANRAYGTALDVQRLGVPGPSGFTEAAAEAAGQAMGGPISGSAARMGAALGGTYGPGVRGRFLEGVVVPALDRLGRGDMPGNFLPTTRPGSGDYERWSNVLRGAAAAGQLPAAHWALTQQSPEYRRFVRRLEEQQQEADQ